jgi:ATP-dependent Clp protease adaptor protein ClpS
VLQRMSGLVKKPEATKAGSKSDTSVVLKERVKTQRPPLYGVILLNDDYTPMEFVIMILEKHFNKDHEGATQIMLKVHTEGRALCGIYPYEIAETKVTLVTQEAQRDGHPLQCVLERT